MEHADTTKSGEIAAPMPVMWKRWHQSGAEFSTLHRDRAKAYPCAALTACGERIACASARRFKTAQRAVGCTGLGIEDIEPVAGLRGRTRVDEQLHQHFRVAG